MPLDLGFTGVCGLWSLCLDATDAKTLGVFNVCIELLMKYPVHCFPLYGCAM